MENEIEHTELYRADLESRLRLLIKNIGEVPIGTSNQFPFGWRKAAKGRTVWRIIEELISQNLEAKGEKIGLYDFQPAKSEVGVYDFSFRFEKSNNIYINIKSAVSGVRTNKDDISKAEKLIEFFKNTPNPTLFIATIEIAFKINPLRIELNNCYVIPVTWLPDVYVNPSNNGNLQSSKYKEIDHAVKRGKAEFLKLLEAQIEMVRLKRRMSYSDN